MKKIISALFSWAFVVCFLFSGCVDNVQNKGSENSIMNISANGYSLNVDLVDNSSVRNLIEILKEKPLVVPMSDYENFEKVGDLGHELPRNDEAITTEPGDVILFQGRYLVIYYGKNSWSFTRLGKINNTSKEELLRIFGPGDVQVTLSL